MKTERTATERGLGLTAFIIHSLWIALLKHGMHLYAHTNLYKAYVHKNMNTMTREIYAHLCTLYNSKAHQ